MKCVSPCPEVILYVSGMLFLAFGIGSLIVSIDPKPFDSNSWKSFLFTGVSFLFLGGIVMVFTATVPECPRKTYSMGEIDRIAYSSAVDLLEDVQSVGCLDSPIVQLRESKMRVTEESVRTVKSCMMMQSPLSGSDGILFYKETVV